MIDQRVVLPACLAWSPPNFLQKCARRPRKSHMGAWACWEVDKGISVLERERTDLRGKSVNIACQKGQRICVLGKREDEGRVFVWRVGINAGLTVMCVNTLLSDPTQEVLFPSMRAGMLEDSGEGQEQEGGDLKERLHERGGGANGMKEELEVWTCTVG